MSRTFFILALLACSLSQFRAADFHVLSGQSLELGIPGVETNYFFDTFTVDASGKLAISGEVRVTVANSIQIDGDVFSLPTAEQIEGDPGIDGEDGVDNQPTGLNAATGGELGGRGKDWVISGSLLTLNSSKSIVINGTVRLIPKLDGGAGGKGGEGGNGGSGSTPDAGHSYGAIGGFGGQGGEGGEGGFGGLASTLRLNASEHIELGPDSILALDNAGVGGDGGDGGKGGSGGKGGNGIGSGNGGDGGGSGPPGSGGRGADGPGGGTITLIAKSVTMFGTITLVGGDGGNGGNAGEPADGGDAGAAGPGGGGLAGRGGDVSPSTAVTAGGKGGNGGPGGSLYLNTQVLTNEAIIDLSGGVGGEGGDGFEAGKSKGGIGGGGIGMDSPEILNGAAGLPGIPGSIYLVDPFQPGTFWKAVPPGDVSKQLVDGLTPVLTLTSQDQATGISASVNTASARPLELTLRYHWVTSQGSLDVLVGSNSVLHVEAPAIVSPGFSETRLLIPSDVGAGFQVLGARLNPMASSQIQIAQLSLLSVPERLSISRSSDGSLSLSWFGTSNAVYQVQSRAMAGQGAWTNLGSSIRGQGAVLSVPQGLDAFAAASFFRLAISLPP